MEKRKLLSNKRLKKTAMCDASTGVDYSNYTPHIIRCENKAKEHVKYEIVREDNILEGSVFDMYLCDECFERIFSGD